MSRYGFRRTHGLWLVLVVERDSERVVDWHEVANAATAGIVGDNLQQNQYHPASYTIVIKAPDEA